MIITPENLEIMKASLEHLPPLFANYLGSDLIFTNRLNTLVNIGSNIGNIYNIFNQAQWVNTSEYLSHTVRFYNIIKLSTSMDSANWHATPIVFAITSLNYFFGNLYSLMGQGATDPVLYSELASAGSKLVLQVAASSLELLCQSMGINYVSVPMSSIIQ